MSDAIHQHQEIKQSSVIVDPRNMWKRMWDRFEKPWLPLAWAFVAATIISIWPGFVPFALLIFGILWLAVVCKPDVLPIHLPMEANKPDLNDPKPADSGFYKARGSFYIGKIREKGTEVWVSFKALTQHFLIFGTTGAGKTESIVSYIVNYLSVGSGVAFQDAKAAPKAMIQMATFCRIFGRDDDFRVTNYITGMSSARRDPAERISNDAAIFARGSAESNTQLLVSLMPPSEGDNKIFSERAIALLFAEMPALTDLRDQGALQLDPGVIRKHMGFKQFAELFRDNRITKRSRDALAAYLESLPGYNEKVDIDKQPEEVTRQFGFAQAYFTRALSSLSDTYGHIYLVGQGEIDYQDAVLNGRILMTLLPSMEKAGDELANLGKIVLTATKNGMVVGLGTIFEGSADDIVHNLPTNSDIPYGIMNDENAYMLVEGQEMINAQARGLGFGVLTGTQDAPGMLEKISRTTKQIMANSAFKQIMYLDDKETTDLAVEFSGEANVIVRGRYEMSGDMNNIYSSKDVSIERRPRLTATAIKKQGLGQAYLMYQGKVHEMQVFNHGIQEKHADPRMCFLTHWYSVRMAKVKAPTVPMLRNLTKIDPRPEWIHLMSMISDESRAMLKEMTSYFHSMLTINRLTDRFLEHDFEAPSGILKTISEKAPDSHLATASLYALLLKTHDTEQTKLQKLVEMTGLSAPGESTQGDYDCAPIFFDGDNLSDSDEESGGGAGGSGGGGLSEMPNTDDLLSSYFETPPQPAVTPVVDTAVEADNSAQYDEGDYELEGDDESARLPTENPEHLSAYASAVERNLGNMPWLAGSATQYNEVRNQLVATEEFFIGNADLAQSKVDDTLALLGDAFGYPETPMPKTPLEPGKIFSLLQDFKSDNR